MAARSTTVKETILNIDRMRPTSWVGFAQKILGGHRPPLQLGVRNCRGALMSAHDVFFVQSRFLLIFRAARQAHAAEPLLRRMAHYKVQRKMEENADAFKNTRNGYDSFG